LREKIWLDTIASSRIIQYTWVSPDCGRVKEKPEIAWKSVPEVALRICKESRMIALEQLPDTLRLSEVSDYEHHYNAESDTVCILHNDFKWKFDVMDYLVKSKLLSGVQHLALDSRVVGLWTDFVCANGVLNLDYLRCMRSLTVIVQVEDNDEDWVGLQCCNMTYTSSATRSLEHHLEKCSDHYWLPNRPTSTNSTT
jgi:hypothetical protein